MLETDRCFVHRLDESVAPFQPQDTLFSQGPRDLSEKVGLTLDELIKAYLRAHKATWRPKTYRTHEPKLRLLAEYLGGDRLADSITRKDLIHFPDELLRLRRNHHTMPAPNFHSRQTDNPKARIMASTATGIRVTVSEAQRVLKHIYGMRHLLTYLHIVPAKWFWSKTEGVSTKSAIKDLNEIFALMGLEFRRREGTATHTSGMNCISERGANVGRKQRHHFYELDRKSFEYMSVWSKRRNDLSALKIIEQIERRSDNDDDFNVAADYAG